MNDAATILAGKADGIHPSFPDSLLSWSGHAASWLDQESIPVHALRYEDLHADPVAAFGAVVRFAGFTPRAAELRKAVDRAAFDRLRAQEEQFGFGEMQPGARSFFRVGVVGGWRGRLSPHRARQLVRAHRTVMARFGYLDGLPGELRDGVK